MSESAILSDFLSAVGPAVGACVDASVMARALYSSDASLYRVVPQAVARPHDADELAGLLEGARAVGLPVTARGAGTSCAGNAVGPGLVIDLKRLDRIHSIDPDACVAEVDPGVVQDTLQRAARPYHLRFGPDPSTSTRCTIGGIVANNACGPRALGYGVAATNLVDADVITGTGDRVRLGQFAGGNSSHHPLSNSLNQLVDANLGVIRPAFGRFSRQVSGYGMDRLLPEKGRDLVSFFAGTEGTLGVATRLWVRLATDPARTLTIALGYPSMADAADATPGLLPFRPTAVEGMDSRIVGVVRHTHGDAAVPDLPRGTGWLFLELGGDNAKELAARGAQVIATADALEGWIVDDPAQAAALWKIRSDGAGLAGVSLAKPAYPGWEDAAVPCSELGAYLRDFEALLAQYDFHTLPYGHFGEGCVHARIDFPLTEAGGLRRYHEFVADSARLVASHGGSLSGEHGDGRARSDLLPLMYPTAAIDLFNAVKRIFDPRDLFNPGVIAHPVADDQDVRYTSLVDNPLVAAHPLFSAQVHRCAGVGACVAAQPNGVMCPSYQATREEQNSTRGRARILQELMNGSLVHGWDSPEVAAALDLCLACKGCLTQCPTSVDIASAKSYALDQRYHGKLRPRSHYTLGWLPRWGRLIARTRLGGLVNGLLGLPGLGPLATRLAGVDKRRPLPRFASRLATVAVRRGTSRHASDGEQVTLVGRDGRPLPVVPVGSPSITLVTEQTPTPVILREVAGSTSHDPTTPVVVWVDSFTDSFEGTALPALLKVLVTAGYEPYVLNRTACCGLTWITTGQRDTAAHYIRAALDQLAPIAEAGIPIVGMEPSCVTVWRSDAAELVDDPRVAEVAKAIHTLAELLHVTPGWTPPDLSGHEILAQPHCHHASVLGWHTDAALLQRTGATVTTIDGCCGLAGNFGVETGHYETSVAVAETHLLPALRANPNAIVLADGFSCRKQVLDLANRQAMTLAELLAAHIPSA